MSTTSGWARATGRCGTGFRARSPAQPTAEDVAFTIYTQDISNPATYRSDQAFRILGSPPYFRIPVETAAQIAEANKFKPVEPADPAVKEATTPPQTPQGHRVRAERDRRRGGARASGPGHQTRSARRARNRTRPDSGAPTFCAETSSRGSWMGWLEVVIPRSSTVAVQKRAIRVRRASGRRS